MVSKSYHLFKVCLTFVCSLGVANALSVDITTIGAVGDGKTDSTKALSDAWSQVCAAAGGGTVIIPAGNFLVGPVLFSGIAGKRLKCNGPVTIQLDGNLLADSDLSEYTKNWLNFQYIDGLTIQGKGIINGQGAGTWPKSNCQWNCNVPPMSLNFAYVNNIRLSGFTSKDSKYFHLDFFQCDTVDIQNLIVTSPEDSPNTDGIYFGHSRNINIAHTKVGSGNYCMSTGCCVTNFTFFALQCEKGLDNLVANKMINCN